MFVSKVDDPLRMTSFVCAAVLLFAAAVTEKPLPVIDGLVLDLNADRDVALEDSSRVVSWRNQVESSPAQLFVKRDEGRERPGSGRPTLRTDVEAIDGHSTLIFRQQELVNMQEDVFDALTTGSGYTWFCVMTVYDQRVGLEDVNSFFGNLRNGGNYEGLWGNLTDENSVWVGSRNGVTFGRFDANNPKLLGPRLEPGSYHIVAARMGSGTDTVSIELFVDDTTSDGTVAFPVNETADPSRLAIGQERDAVEHPGRESFDGAITRFLIYERPLDDSDLQKVFTYLKEAYLSHQ